MVGERRNRPVSAVTSGAAAGSHPSEHAGYRSAAYEAVAIGIPLAAAGRAGSQCSRRRSALPYYVSILTPTTFHASEVHSRLIPC